MSIQNISTSSNTTPTHWHLTPEDREKLAKWEKQHNWDKKYLLLADHIASWSKDPSRKVGAVAIGRVGQILATGYNGFPRGIEDTEERLNNRELKYPLTAHAEMNCIYNATYNGVSLDGSTLYVNFPVCNDCAVGVIQVGIKRVVLPFRIPGLSDLWLNKWMKTMEIFDEAAIEVSHADIPIYMNTNMPD